MIIAFAQNRDIVVKWSRPWAGNRLIVGSNPASARLYRRPCASGVAWDAVPKLMVEYFDPDCTYYLLRYAGWVQVLMYWSCNAFVMRSCSTFSKIVSAGQWALIFYRAWIFDNIAVK